MLLFSNGSSPSRLQRGTLWPTLLIFLEVVLLRNAALVSMTQKMSQKPLLLWFSLPGNLLGFHTVAGAGQEVDYGFGEFHKL